MLHEREEDGQPDANCAQCYFVTGIHGVTGSRNSTHIQLVCSREKTDRQEKKDGHFDLVMWIHVSQDFGVEIIFKEIFEAATVTFCPYFNTLDSLQSNLEKELHGNGSSWYNMMVGT
jgi:hypothetical protein